MSWMIANAPTSWGIEQPDDPRNIDPELLLDQVQAAGYQGVELGPLGYFPTAPGQLAEALATRSLAMPAGYLLERFHDPAARSSIRDRTRQVCALLDDVGAQVLVIIGALDTERIDTAGRTDVAERLDGAGFQCFVEALSEVIEIAGESGITVALHAHAGSHVEFRDEIDRLMAEPALERCGLCVDTGHVSFAGIDPESLIREYASRIAYVHLKDLSSERRDAGIGQSWGFWEFYRQQVFVPLGSGTVDFTGVADALRSIGYEGWLTVEQDADPSSGTDPFRDAQESRHFLAQAQLAARG